MESNYGTQQGYKKIFIFKRQEKYECLTDSHFKGSDAVLIVFDLTDECSFNNVNKWY